MGSLLTRVLRSAVLTACLAACASARVQLPALLSDHMLLQRDTPIRIWGKADPGEQVAVEFRGETARTTADDIGRWSVFLSPAPAGGPYEMTVRGSNAITLRNILVGEVWVASGQSNMAWTVKASDNASEEIRAANYPKIRLFRVALKSSDVPLDDVTGTWKECSPDTVGDFSAVGYYFARHLHQKLNVPVGVIQSAWGGTPADAWTSLGALASDPALTPAFSDWARMLASYPQATARHAIAMKRWEEAAAKAKAEGRQAPPRPNPPVGPGSHWMPGGLYNAMIAPLTPYAIRGAIWYQGESNTGPTRAPIYARLFQTMIRDWRRAWGQGDFPFLFVQLANFGKTAPGSQWPEVREAQLDTLSLAKTGMAVTIDIGNPNDIHPTNKQDVGLRLGLAARAIAYGENIVYSGPIFRSAAPMEGALRLHFDFAGSGLQAKGGALKGFEVAGADGKFVSADARIDGSTVIVSSSAVPKPVAARYGWSDAPECNLYNAEGLPASPFRTR